MIKTPDLNFKQILLKENFDPYFSNNKPAKDGREGEKDKNNEPAEKTHLLANYHAIKARILKEVSDNPHIKSEIDMSILNIDPYSMKLEELNGLIKDMSSIVNVVVVPSETDEEPSLAQSFINKCKSLLLGKNHCHDDKAVNVAVQGLGSFKPLPGEIVPAGFVTGPSKVKIPKAVQI